MMYLMKLTIQKLFPKVEHVLNYLCAEYSCAVLFAMTKVICNCRWKVAMRSSLRDVTRRAYEAYAVSDRVTWILTWPGQVVLCGSSMYWTAEVAAAIREKGLPAYEAKCTLQLQAIVNKVPTGISFRGASQSLSC